MRIEFIGGPWDGMVKDLTSYPPFFNVAELPEAQTCVRQAALPAEPLTYKEYTYRLAQYDYGEYVYICQR